MFPRLDTAAQEVEQRLKAFLDLGLMEAESIPIFEAATQTAADFLEVPICILGFLDRNSFWFKSAVGLSRLGLRSKIAQERQLPRQEPFSIHVVENHKILAIDDALIDPVFASSVLVQQYGIRAYLGAPLMNTDGQCLGAIAVMDLKPRTFTLRDMKFLELMACWSMSELERNQLLKGINPSRTYAVAPETTQQPRLVDNPPFNSIEPPISMSSPTVSPLALGAHRNTDSSPQHEDTELFSANQLKLELLSQLTQELRTPLTSVLGMANVVSREIYGPLTTKQKEYLAIIEDSGRHLLSLVNEISDLGALDNNFTQLNLSSVEVEMLCQQIIAALSETAKRREQQIDLSIEPGRSRIWNLDKEKVKQLLYQLIFYITQIAATGSIIHIHVSYKSDGLNFVIWASHPWLEQGLTDIEPTLSEILPFSHDGANKNNPGSSYQVPDLYTLPTTATPVFAYSSNLRSGMSSELEILEHDDSNQSTQKNLLEGLYYSSHSLRLLLSCDLAKLHGGRIDLQGTSTSGYRYIVVLPELTAPSEEE